MPDHTFRPSVHDALREVCAECGREARSHASMPDSIRVPDIPGTSTRLCRGQDLATRRCCDRIFGHRGLHSFEWAAITTALAEAEAELVTLRDELALTKQLNASQGVTFGQVEAHEHQLMRNLTVLRRHHAEAVEQAFREALPLAVCNVRETLVLSADAAWLASQAKAALEGKHE